MFRRRGFGRGEFDHFNFIKLVEALKAAGILPGRTRFAAEAWGVGRVADRQFLCKDFVTVHIGYRHFGCRDGVKTVEWNSIHILRKLG